MNTLVSSRRSEHQRGITLIEILLCISVLIVLVSFALPSVSGAALKSEMKATAENVEHSIHSARNLARLNEKSIAVHFESVPYDRITFSAPGSHRTDPSAALQEYRLPEGIELIPARESLVFDARGLVDAPARITLVARADAAVSHTFDVN
ncbi:MAG: type II secretion system protein [Lysobacterales bacterium]|jgi:type II secretory pathway pseudopilin PulG